MFDVGSLTTLFALLSERKDFAYIHHFLSELQNLNCFVQWQKNELERLVANRSCINWKFTQLS